MICPVDVNNFGLQNLKTSKYIVVQKVQVLKAFQELHKVGEFVHMSGHSKGTVLCYILNTNRQDLRQYGNVRENFITSQFARKTLPQDLLHHFHTLSRKDSSVKAAKVLERMARLCCIGPDECTAMDKLSKWFKEGS